jgi:hypothetical protein
LLSGDGESMVTGVQGTKDSACHGGLQQNQWLWLNPI